MKPHRTRLHYSMLLYYDNSLHHVCTALFCIILYRGATSFNMAYEGVYEGVYMFCIILYRIAIY